MPFDADGTFHDGTTITADITPTSETRSSGSAVLPISKTGAKGLVATMILQNDLAESSDLMQVTIEESATAGGTDVEVARFPLLTKGTGMPGTYIRRFDSDKAFIRCKIDITDDDSGGDFTVAGVYIYLAFHPFTKL